MGLEGSNAGGVTPRGMTLTQHLAYFSPPNSPCLLCRKESPRLLVMGSQTPRNSQSGPLPCQCCHWVGLSRFPRTREVNPIADMFRSASQIHLVSFSPLTLVSFLVLVLRATGSSNASSCSLLVWFLLALLFWGKSWFGLGHPKWNLASDPPDRLSQRSPAQRSSLPQAPKTEAWALSALLTLPHPLVQSVTKSCPFLLQSLLSVPSLLP